LKDEPVDVLDEQGNETGQVLMKSEVHNKSLWHPVAHLWIYNSKGEVLLQKRSENKVVWPGVWDVSVAGHIAAGDNPEETLIREAEEELAIKVSPKNVVFFDLSKFEDEMPGGWINRVFISSYMAKMDLDISNLSLEAEETSEVRWVGLNELEAELDNPEQANHFSPAGKIFFRTAIKAIRTAK
jgi:isopentenyl-diphosphate delta-isomerase